jgi:hypothetical protein
VCHVVASLRVIVVHDDNENATEDEKTPKLTENS